MRHATALHGRQNCCVASAAAATTQWVAIDGGDHAQFGWYGPQDGDQPATISREAQQAQVLARP